MTALRSGEYTQLKHQLSAKIEGSNEKFGYCCEGVAAERYGPALGYVVDRNENGVLRAADNELGFSRGSVLAAPARFWQDMGLRHEGEVSFVFELPDGLQTRPGDDEEDEATQPTNTVAYSNLNDNGFTFDQIADLIEWQFLSCRTQES